MSYQYKKQFKRIIAETLVLTLLATNMLFGVDPVDAISTDPIPSNGGYMQIISSPAVTNYNTFGYGCGLRDDNSLWCWGYNEGGFLGTNGTDTLIRTPQEVIFPVDTKIQYVVTQSRSFFAVMEDGSVYAWGNNKDSSNNPILGVGSSASIVTSPALVQGLAGEKVTHIVTQTHNTNSTASVYVLTESGSMYVWGDNIEGQLGLGHMNPSGSPTKLNTLPTGKKIINIVAQDRSLRYPGGYPYEVFAGSSMYVLLDDNTVYTWGSNVCDGAVYGCIGIGNTTDPVIGIPTMVPNLRNVPIKAIKTNAGGQSGWNLRHQYTRSVAILYTDGGISVWGGNNVGQLGLGDTTDQSSPVTHSITGVQELYSGVGNFFAVMNDGTVKAWGNNGTVPSWGDNTKQYLGINSTDPYRTTPADVLGLPSGVKVKKITYTISLASSEYATFLALLENGDVYIWGGYYPVDGENYSQTVTQATKIESLSSFGTFIDIQGDRERGALGNIYFLQDNGLVYASGYGGNLGINALAMNATITLLDKFRGIRVNTIVVGSTVAYATTDEGHLYGWGANFTAPLGAEDRVKRLDTTLINLSGSVSSVVTNTDDSTFAVMQDGRLYGWGNVYGSSPVLINLSGSVSSVSGGYAVMTNGELYQISGTTGTQVNLSGSVSSVVTNGNSTFAVMQDGSVYGWGENWYGQLGVGDTTQRSSPTLINLSGSVSSVVTNGNSTFAVMQDGRLYGWGSNGYGQLGVGDTTQRSSPTLINLSGSVSSVVTSTNGSVFVVMQDGRLYGWGSNGYGQLGVGDTTQRSSPTLINLSGSVSSVVTSTNGSVFVVMQDGRLYGWGYNGDQWNGYGLLGVGDMTSQHVTTPTQLNLPGSVSSVVINNGSTFAVQQDGSVYGWGYNNGGLLMYPNMGSWGITRVVGPDSIGQLDLLIPKSPINASGDSYSGLNISTGSVDVLGNDTYSGGVATLENISISLLGWTGGLNSNSIGSSISVSPDGSRIVSGGLSGAYMDPTDNNFIIPLGATPGDYTVSYKICDKNYNPRNCSVASIVVSIRLPEVVARTDSGSILSTESGSINLLANDTYSGALAHSGNVSITLIANTVSGATLSPSGILSVPPGVSVGKYSFIYQICDVMNMSSVGGVNTGNCSMAPVYVNITSNDIGSGTGSGSSSSLPIITALTDSGSFQNTQTGSVDLFANDSYSGSTPTQSTVTVSLVGNTLSGATVSPEGILTVPPNSLSGTYYAVYQICDKIHANNCSSAVVTLHITGSGVNPPGGNGSTNTGSTNTGSTSTGSTNTGNTNTGTIIPPATTPSSGGGGYSPSPIVPVSVPVQVGTMSGVNMLGGSVVGTLVGGNVFGGSGLLLYSAPTLAGSSSVGSGSGGLSGSGGSIGSQGTSAPTLPTILFPTFVPSCTSAVKNLDDPRLSVYFDEIGVVDKTNIDRRLTRVEFLKLVLNAAKVDLSKAPRETSFQDVRNNTWYAPYVSYAKTASIISGDTTGNFRPNDMITRAEASKIFVQVLGVKPIIGKTSFADIPKSSTLGHYVEAAYESCLVHGRNTLNGEPREGEERKFEPHDTISLGETGKVLYNLIQR